MNNNAELTVDIKIDENKWRKIKNIKDFTKKIITDITESVDIKKYQEISIYYTKYRGIKKPTNVLSFPAGLPLLGDIVLSYEYIDTECKQQNKTLEAHVTHMILHGLLHLLEYNHATDEDADTMENIEINILKILGYENPYIIYD
jgi:probable rRNA maturation factor